MAGRVGVFRIMKTMVRVSSRQDEHVTDQYLWPESLPLILPSVGDEIETSRFGLRTIVRRHFTYKSTASGSNVTDLIVDVICE
jgi:gamma-glutamylcysteine synthetase